MAYLWLVLSGACSVAASVALKAAGASPAGALPASLAAQAFPYLAAIGAYGLGFGFYALALRQLDLSLAYPLMVAIAIAGVFIYGLLSGAESISGMRMAGAALIAAGVFLISK
ncbi:SMR family transporter [Achromobacter seleniivolatilans]|uniref:SMR family transporter n=1 Tax=Achromobacter seleniivolatilans TaxID=3047478 RepID=A0ABY9LZ64_9BURK|nr:SMR family transporter [Achromobacter sp. R39]WMD19765.1 SMR family transporter [Achromobacter sp. R39]